jgi:thiosulfate dehydrogenase [quinone] large subunit
VVGFWFLKAGLSHLAWTPLPWVSARWAEMMPKIVAGNAKEHPFAFYKAFLENVVLPNSDLFASLSGIGEFLVGVSLTFGILSTLGGLGGLFLTVLYGLMTIASVNSQGFHLILLTSMIIFLVTRPGRHWGVDAMLSRLNPRLPLW